MDEALDRIISGHLTELAERDESVIRSTVKTLECECRGELCEKFSENDVLRSLWLRLAASSVRFQNIDLSLLIAAKLKLIQLVLLLKSLSSENTSKIKKLIALSYVKSYFCLEDVFDPIDQITEAEIKECGFEEHKELIECHINSNRWVRALEVTQIRYGPDENRNLIHRRVIYFRLAQHLEAEENYAEALINYEKAQLAYRHALRIIIKHHLSAAGEQLRNYCMDRDERFKKLWTSYLEASNGKLPSGDKKPSEQSRPMNGNTQCSRVLEVLPQVSTDFVLDNNSSKWFNNRRKLDLVASSGSSLVGSSRRDLAQLAATCLRAKRPDITCGLLLTLGQSDLVVHHLTSSLVAIRFACLYTSYHDCLPAAFYGRLIDYMTKDFSRKNKGQETVAAKAILCEAYAKVGLMDESLRVLSLGVTPDILAMVKFLESIDSRSGECLNSIDTDLKTTTLLGSKASMINNPTSSTPVIAIVILCITILLRKLSDATLDTLGDGIIQKLEVMLQHLADYTKSLNFTASDELVKVTGNLIGAVKDKLDAFSDSRLIRESFSSVVDEVASKCMVEARYKSAATLYSQIEDNVSAVKSLMRTGDVDVVMDFSLLVKDVAVNRITINFLKHLRLDNEVIEDFISRSKTQ